MTEFPISLSSTTVSVLGGSGPLGRPGATTAAGGLLVIVGSRQAEHAQETARALSAGTGGVYGGRLHHAHEVESLTANFIRINRRYMADAGVRVTDF